jgi:hypothetical protein
MRVDFDEETHTYYHGGKEVPGVTSILKAVGLSKDYSTVDTFYRDRGIAVALAIELFLKGTLDEKTIDPAIQPYYDGFRRYWDKHASKPVGIEAHNGDEDLWFAGKVDLITATRIIDWKCSKSHDPVAELQGEGYKTLWQALKLPFDVVQFDGTGDFKIFEYGDRIDTWPAVMKCFEWWKKAHPRTKM